MKKIEDLDSLIKVLQTIDRGNNKRLLKQKQDIMDCLVPELQSLFEDLHVLKDLTVKAQLGQKYYLTENLLLLEEDTLHLLLLCFPTETLYWKEIISEADSLTIKRTQEHKRIHCEGLSIYIRPSSLSGEYIIEGDTFHIKDDLKNLGCKFRKNNSPLYVLQQRFWTVKEENLPLLETFFKNYTFHHINYEIKSTI